MGNVSTQEDIEEAKDDAQFFQEARLQEESSRNNAVNLQSDDDQKREIVHCRKCWQPIYQDLISEHTLICQGLAPDLASSRITSTVYTNFKVPIIRTKKKNISGRTKKDLIKCKFCKSRLLPKNLEKHMAKVHPKEHRATIRSQSETK